MKLRVWARTDALAALLLLTGCDQLAAGNGLGRQRHQDHRRTRSRSSLMPSAWLPTRPRRPEAARRHALSRIHQQSLYLLIDAELSQQYAEKEGLERVEGPGGCLLQRVRGLPRRASGEAPHRARGPVHGLGREPRRARRRPAARPPARAPSEQNVEQLLNAGLQERASVAEEADIDTDPRYAPGEDGFPVAATPRSPRPVPTSRRTPARRRPTPSGSARFRPTRSAAEDVAGSPTTSESASADVSHRASSPRSPSCPR